MQVLNKKSYGFFAPYIPMPKGRGFTALLARTPVASAAAAL
jgi:hypothetical protein